MTIFFSADHHFGHKNIIEYCNRLYSSVEEMNENLVARWNSVVTTLDTVYYLGDFSLSMRVMEEITPRLNGMKILIAGNHDGCHHMHKKWSKAMYRYLEAGWYVRNSMQSAFAPDPYDLNGLAISLCHMPYQSDERHGDKYAEWRAKDRGEWLLHGHVHNSWKIKGRQVNVGVDVWNYYPVRLEHVLRTIKEVNQ